MLLKDNDTEFLNKTLKELGDGKYNYSYFDMVKILNSEPHLKSYPKELSP